MKLKNTTEQVIKFRAMVDGVKTRVTINPNEVVEVDKECNAINIFDGLEKDKEKETGRKKTKESDE